MRDRLSYLLMTFLLTAVILAFQIPNILAHKAWATGRETTLGHVDSISDGRKIREVFYSYDVEGKTYHGDFEDSSRFDIGPVEVIYAPGNPSVSTLDSATDASEYRVSVIIAILSPIPIIVFFVYDPKRRIKPGVEPKTS